jgi:hypothetical protein
MAFRSMGGALFAKMGGAKKLSEGHRRLLRIRERLQSYTLAFHSGFGAGCRHPLLVGLPRMPSARPIGLAFTPRGALSIAQPSRWGRLASVQYWPERL